MKSLVHEVAKSVGLDRYFKSNRIRPDTTPESDKRFHQESITDLLKLHEIESVKKGLSSERAADYLIKNGPNKLPESKSMLMSAIFKNLAYGFGPVLCVASILSFLLFYPFGGTYPVTQKPFSYVDELNLVLKILFILRFKEPVNIVNCIMIIIILILQVAFVVLQDYSSSKAMKSILTLAAHRSRVIRDGKRMKIPATDLVVGDIVVLTNGSKVPADLRIFETTNLTLNNSMITGECEPVKATTDAYEKGSQTKFTEATNVAFMSSFVVNGTGKGIVVATGTNTFISSIIQLTDSKRNNQLTHLQKEINRFSVVIVLLSIFTIFILLICWFTWIRTSYPSYQDDANTLFSHIISIILGYVPLALPVSLTIVLWVDARKMSHSQVIVKNLTAVETLSSVNVIASDKTGTLTQNKMRVVSILSGIRNVDIDSCFYNSVVYIGVDNALTELLAICRLCNDAKISRDGRKGNATDLALLQFSENNLKLGKLKPAYSLVYEKKFNSNDKYQIAMYKPKDLSMHETIFGILDYTTPYYMLVKGAPDVLMPKCKFIVNSEGLPVELDEGKLNHLQNIQNEWSKTGKRVILICKRLFSDIELHRMMAQKTTYFNENINDLCVVGMLGLVDPPKEGIAEVLAQCKKAGIRIIMVTGDYSATATAIANEIGIFSSEKKNDTLASLRASNTRRMKMVTHDDRSTSIAMTPSDAAQQIQQLEGSILLSGNELDYISSDEWKQICCCYLEIVIARSTPQHKIKVIREFQRNGFTIAMTGDGINDAPALKRANVGIAMGNGNSVAMDAADVILMDNSFTHIISSIENGRLVCENLRKLICYLIPMGVFAQMVGTCLNMFFGVPAVISPFPSSIIGFFTDTIASISLIFEKRESNLLESKPRSNNEHLINKALVFKAVILIGIQISFFQLLSYFLYIGLNSGLTIKDIFFTFDKWGGGYLNYTSAQINDIQSGAQTASFLAVITMQLFGTLLCVRTRRLSIFNSFPTRKEHRNIWLLLCIAVGYIILMLSVFLPGLRRICNTKPISFGFFVLPFGYSAFILTCEEIRKLLIRRGVIPPRYAW